MKEPRYLAALRAEANFLPAWYVERRRRRRSRRRQVAALILMVAVMAVVIADAERTRGDLRAEHAALREQVAATHRAAAEVADTRAAHAERARQLEVHRTLHQPVGYSEVAGTLASLTPPSVALRSLEMRTEYVTPRRRSGGNAASDESSNRGGRAGSTQPPARPIISIELEGIAPADTDVADFIGDLSASALFNEVEMLYARHGARGDLLTREFRIRMEVPLDRVYKRAGSPEVADAH